MCKNRMVIQAVDLVGFALFVDRIFEESIGNIIKT